LDLEERLSLVLRNTEEVVTPEEIRNLLETKTEPKAYWGFECSGFMHVGIGLVPGAKIRDMVKAGFNFTIFLADWHSWINNKLDGDMDNIRACGEYFRHCFEALGVVSDKTKIVWAAEIAEDIGYWERVVRIAKASSLARVRRALTIMGRELDASDIETAWVLYPCMQASDIFHLDLDVAAGGMDQRKAHMLARDSADKLGWKKPSCVHTPLVSGLQKPEIVEAERKFDEDAALSRKISAKMSKSKPESCIFVHDTPKDIKFKMRNAYCPPKEAEGNPVLEFAQYIVFPALGSLEVPRPPKYGRKVGFESYEALREAYLKGAVHPLDLKNGVAEALVRLLKPVREHFKRNPEPLERMRRIETTR